MRWLHEPLVHFLLIGAGLFLLHDWIAEPLPLGDRPIVITRADLDRLDATWLRRTGRPPSNRERQAELQRYIRDEVLYRESLAMGLDRDDLVVRRRLIQKMEFLFSDLSAVPDPTEAELRAWWEENAAALTEPARLSFVQIHLDPDRRGPSADRRASLLLDRLRREPEMAWEGLGDSSLLPHRLRGRHHSEVAAEFGERFASRLLTLPVGRWEGPVRSAFGLHLVRITDRREARLPPLVEIRDRVAHDWRRAREREANEAFYQSVRKRYDIVLEDVGVEDRLASLFP